MSAARFARSLGCGWLLCNVAGCHIPGLIPDTSTPADHAREIEPRCEGFAEERIAPLLSASTFDAVEPAYSYVKSGPDDHEARLRGARLKVKPLPAFSSKEALARVVECHEARVTLGRVAAPADDPYVLPGYWLDVDVDSEGDGFVVLVRADGIHAAQQVLERARRFVSHRAE
jgi:hypothetical protein